MFRYLIAGALAIAAPALPAQEPRLLPNGWFYGEAGNYCMATRELPGGARLMMRLTKWTDLSESLIFWAPDLPALDEEDEAAAQRGHGLTVHIDGVAIELLAYQTRPLEDFLDKPGTSYRIGLRQRPFIAALARGRSLEIRRDGRPLATFPIDGSADMARQMSECIARNPRL